MRFDIDVAVKEKQWEKRIMCDIDIDKVKQVKDEYGFGWSNILYAVSDRGAGGLDVCLWGSMLLVKQVLVCFFFSKD